MTHIQWPPANPARFIPTLSFSQVCARLGLSAATIAALRRVGLLVYARHVLNDRATRGPTIESVERFEKGYVSARELAATYAMTVRSVMAALKNQGVQRVVSGGKDVQAVYLRDAASAVISIVEHNAA